MQLQLYTKNVNNMGCARMSSSAQMLDGGCVSTKKIVYTSRFVRVILVGTHTNELNKNIYGLTLLSTDCVNVLRGAKKHFHWLNLLTIKETCKQ